MHQEVFYSSSSFTDRENLKDLHSALGIPRVPDGLKKQSGILGTRFFGAMAKVCAIEPDNNEIEQLSTSVREFVSKATNATTLLNDLQNLALDKFGPICGLLLAELESSDPIHPWHHYKHLQNERLKIVRQHTYEEIEEKRPAEEDPLLYQIKHILVFGIENSAHTAWSFYELIPRVYMQQFGTTPDVESAIAIANSVPDIVAALSSSQDDVFRAILDLVRLNGISRNGDELWPPYDSKAFYITPELELRIRPSIYQHVHTTCAYDIETGNIIIEGDEQRGCPAHKLISAIVGWCSFGLRDGLYHNIDSLLALPHYKSE